MRIELKKQNKTRITKILKLMRTKIIKTWKLYEKKLEQEQEGWVDVKQFLANCKKNLRFENFKIQV